MPVDVLDVVGDPIGTGTAPTVIPEYKMPIEIRITQVDGGYLINKFGQPLEVCVSLDEVTAKVGAFFTPSVNS